VTDVRRQEPIGRRLRRLREERGLSQRDLASPGVSYAFISRIEAGQRRPSLRSIRVLARKLRVSPDYLETGQPIAPDAERELSVCDAELELRLGRDLAKAEALLAAELEAEAPDSALLARAQAGLGLLAERRNDGDVAIRLLEAATASEDLPPEARPDVYEALGKLYTARGRAEEAVDLFERCLREGRRHTPRDAALATRFGTYLAAAHAALGAAGRARRALDDALEAVDDVPLPQARAQAYWARGLTDWKRARSATALTYMRRAIGLFESSEDTLQLARAHLVAAQMLTLDGRYGDASGHLDRADRLLSLGSSPSDLAALHAERAKVLADEGKADAAVETAAEADRLAGDDLLLRPVVHHGLAAAHAAKGDVAEAERRFAAALEELGRRRRWREAARVAREWSIMLRRAGRVSEALDMMEEAIALTARHVGDPEP
jgi:tetratricopeptide (TPR) repeat protein